MASSNVAATSFNFSVIVIPSAARSDAQNLDFPTLNRSMSFALEISSPNDFTTLYSRDSKAGSTFKGLLYVPDLDPTDPCDRPELVPRNVTRKANLPNDDLKRIAYAPWITNECSLQYMYSAENDNVAAFLFYGVASNYSANSTKQLRDSDYPFEYPVYYLNGAIGQPLMYKLAEYSANMSEVYNGFNLTEVGYDIRDYARILAVISTANSNPMPGLWLFLLVVVAVLVFIIGLSSLLMHLFQFNYRRSLRRRIANGEVDLEGLGIGRITVPREFLAKFPVYVYISETTTTPRSIRAPPPVVTIGDGRRVSTPDKTSPKSPKSPKSLGHERSSSKSSTPTRERASSKPSSPTEASKPRSNPTSPVEATSNERSKRRSKPKSPITAAPQDAVPIATTPVPIPTSSPTPHMARGYSQTSCPICLEDFIHQETMVRELPCLHVFHPDCIDPYLESQSSLCVLCKQSCLPKGYVPIRLTNAIVRRERLMRRVRERSRAHANGNNGRDIPLRSLRREDGGFLFRWNFDRLRRQEEDIIGRRALTNNYGRRSQSYMDHRAGVEDDPVRPRWRETMDRIFPGFR